MDSTKQENSDPTDEAPQQLLGFMSNEDWDAVLAQIADLLKEVENIPYPGVKEKIFDLLQAIDTVHREPLRRLVHVFKEGVLEMVVTDPAIHTLMELYDLLPADPPGGKPLETPMSTYSTWGLWFPVIALSSACPRTSRWTAPSNTSNKTSGLGSGAGTAGSLNAIRPYSPKEFPPDVADAAT